MPTTLFESRKMRICDSSRFTALMIAKACCSGAGRSAQSVKDTKIVAASEEPNRAEVDAVEVGLHQKVE